MALVLVGNGICPHKTYRARLLMERAFEVFEREGATEGGLLSAAAIIKSVILEWNDYAKIDKWTQWISRHIDIDKALPVPEIEIQVASAMVAGLTRRSFCDPALQIWVERTLNACKEVEDATIRLMAKSTILSYYGLLGHWAEMRTVAEDFRRATVDPQVSPLLHLAQVLVVIETHDWVRGSWNDTYNRLIKGFQIAQELRAATHLGMILIYGVWIACEMEDVKMAEEFMQQLEQSPIIEKGMGRAFFHGIASLYHLQKGDAVSAYHYAELAVKASIEAGVPVVEAWNRIALAYALRQQGKSERADEQLKLAERIVLPAGTTHMLYLIRLTQAGLFFNQGRPVEAAHALENAFGIGREKGYGMTLFWHWQPREMARLCAEALSRGIETTYARELISKCRLVPPDNVAKLQSWPWPCQIRTFGDFEILVNDVPLVFTGKVQKKPLTLLKILISLGGRNVHEYTIEDLLWPDSEGDAAHIAFNTNLSRLRRLLGKEQIIEMKGGMLSLNEHLVYLDTWILEDLISNLMKEKRANSRAFNTELVEEYARLIVDTYRADFLPGDNDEWVSTCRERYRKKFAAALEGLVSTFSEMGQVKKAEVYQRYRQNLNFSSVPSPPHR